ncbi:GLPGLI family protein [Mucilaginibacter daejeonensis]|uniref:GLPGLI family protein n=1 Tax=Mucilaginibacter daejeonensis TaxID=398049 RepID=UPI001D17CA0F|nr:GLPGLI family protein [Mucilaginibacter daejeonensis]UEG54598.1 GLPGLI family protein [Mucilaginibacter daejeonensis]
MKLKAYLAAFLLISASTVQAQKADTAQAIIHYKFTHVRDTLNRDQPLVENMMLSVGRSASWYRSYDRKQREEQVRKAAMAQLNSGMTNLNLQGLGAAKFGPNIEYYQFPNENKFFSKERLFTNYLVEEKMPAIAWKISTDTMTIKGLACQKATAHFKGRDYTAWFCADLPYRVGPWKLGGLPGLIVEAYDAKKDVIFQFDGVEKIDPSERNKPADAAPSPASGRTMVLMGPGGDSNANPYVIELPKSAVKVSVKELDDLKEIQRKDPEAFLQAQMASMRAQAPAGANVSFKMNVGSATASGNGISSVNIQSSGGPAKVVTNNPIELPEKNAKK